MKIEQFVILFLVVFARNINYLVGMYLPSHFASEDMIKVRNLIAENSFATILSFPDEKTPFINHLPLIFSGEKNEEQVLIGHMAKKNPQWTHFKKNPHCTVIINGPHAYITPQWYKSGRDVPTWNYAIVHLHGKIQLIESFQGQSGILKQLSDFFEKSNKVPWEFELPDDLKEESVLTAAIISFKFHIEKVEAKFKLSQNRSLKDREGVIEGLAERTDDNSKLIRKMMLYNEIASRSSGTT